VEFDPGSGPGINFTFPVSGILWFAIGFGAKEKNT
jgi:hypothetical protein